MLTQPSMVTPDLRDRLLSILAGASGRAHCVTCVHFPEVTLTYGDDSLGANLPLQPLRRLAEVIESQKLSLEPIGPTALSFSAAQSPAIFQDIGHIFAEMDVNVLPSLPLLRHCVLDVEGSSPLSLHEFEHGTLHTQPYLQFIYRPERKEGYFVRRENSLRARVVTSQVILDLVMMHTNLFGLHGSAVCCNGQGIVFVGDSGAGKTTCALSCIQQGAGFLSDDVSVLTPTGLILPFEHKGLSLRPSTLRHLLRHGVSVPLDRPERQIPGTDDQPSAYVSELFPSAVYSQPTVLRLLAFPSYRASHRLPRIVGIRPEEALGMLKRHLFPWCMHQESLYGVPGKQSKVAAALQRLLTTGAVECVALEYGDDPAQATGCLLEWLTSRSDQVTDGVAR